MNLLASGASLTNVSKPTVAVVFGGRSGEHPISCVTAGGVLGAIDREQFNVIAIGITKDGAWVKVSDAAVDWAVQDHVFPEVLDNGTRVVVPSHVADHNFRLLHPDGRVEDLGEVDVVFPLLHGPYGEDGTLQGMLDLAGIRYVGPGIFASAAGMDKHFTKVVLAHHNIAVGPYEAVTAWQWENAQEEALSRIKALELPVFVKPARAGSSLGISKVNNWEELLEAITEARRHDPKFLVETMIVGREIECGVLADEHGQVSASLPAEITITSQGHDFYDFEAKYLQEAGVQLNCPADLSPQVSELVQKVAVETFLALGAEGLSRVDVFVTPQDRVVVNEVNTMPGFTPISMYPRMWQESGISYSDLVSKLIQAALNRSVGLR